jgi:transposase-like protein
MPAKRTRAAAKGAATTRPRTSPAKGKRARTTAQQANPGGRPTDLTPKVARTIVKAIRDGATYDLAARKGRIAYSTFRNWIRRGEAGDGDAYVKFVEDVRAAEAEDALDSLRQLRKIGKDGNARALMFRLERRFPESYGRTIHDVRLANRDAKETLSDLLGVAPDALPDPDTGATT